MLTRTSRRLLSLSLGTALLAGAVAPATATAPQPDEPGDQVKLQVNRIAAADRYALAARVAGNGDETWIDPDVERVAVVASGQNFPDGLAAGPLAEHEAGVLLLTRKDSVPTVTRSALAALDLDRIIVVGGTGAVSEPVLRELRQYAPRVQRIAGADRYQTAAKVAEIVGVDGVIIEPQSEAVYVATGGNWPDALSAGVAASSSGTTLVLTRKDEVPAASMDALVSIDPPRIVVLGGEGVVSEDVMDQLSARFGDRVDRVGGSNRYVVAANLYRDRGPDCAQVATTGTNYADALVASQVVGVNTSLVLVRPTTLPDPSRNVLEDVGATYLHLLGGTSAVSQGVEDKLESLTVTEAVCYG